MKEEVKKAQEAVWYNTDCKLLTKEEYEELCRYKALYLDLKGSLEGIGWAIWLVVLLILSCGDALIYLLYLTISIPIFIQRAKYDCRDNRSNLYNSMHNTIAKEKEKREEESTDTK